MTLLEQIIESAIDTATPLSVLLRKCLLLAHELRNERLKAWANQELNGYPGDGELPDYRIIGAGAKGNFSGYGGSSLTNYPIPPATLDKKHQSFAEKVEFRQAISAYEEAAKRSDATVVFEWPANLALYYGRKIYRDYSLIAAWQTIPNSAIAEVLDAIRNRTLNMALELKSEIGVEKNLGTISGDKADRINESITQNIFNGPAYFAASGSQVTVSQTNHSHAVITIATREDLDKALHGVGLKSDEITELSSALNDDGATVGKSVKAWITKTAPKVLAGGVQMGSEVAKALLSEWVKQSLGAS